MTRNQLAYRFGIGLFGLAALYGLGLAVAFIAGESDQVALRFLSGFASMFAGILGFATGVVLARGGNGDGNGQGVSKGSSGDSER
jgi:hypothetical protein